MDHWDALPSEALKTMLIDIGIANGPAESYAVALADDGFDTQTAFNTLSIEELRNDFKFKRGHVRMVERARAALLVQAVPVVPAASIPAENESILERID